jgi:hypothetical protein
VIERLGSREAYRSEWMRVREDDVRFAGGATGIYGVVEKAEDHGRADPCGTGAVAPQRPVTPSTART